MLSSIFWLLSWPAIIFLSYYLIQIAIKSFEKNNNVN